MEEQNAEGITFAEPPEGLLKAPENKVVAHMDDPDALCAAVGDLAAAGFEPSEVIVLCSDEGADRLDASGRKHGLKGRLYRLMERALATHEVLVETEQHLRAGGLVISVPAGEDNRATVSRILREHGAHYIHHFGKTMFTRLGA